MTRDEFEQKLLDFMSAAANVESAHEWGTGADAYIVERRAIYEELLAEFDRLTSEVKELNEKLDVQVEFTNDQTEEIGDLQYQIS